MSFDKSISESSQRRSGVPKAVYIENDQVIILLSNGEKLTTLLALHPWLATATAEQQANYELSSFSVDWPTLGEGLDIGWVQSHHNSQTRRTASA